MITEFKGERINKITFIKKVSFFNYYPSSWYSLPRYRYFSVKQRIKIYDL